MYIPVLRVQGSNLPSAWEKSVLKVYHSGTPIQTEYDKPEDPPSLDATMTIVVDSPLAEPMISRMIPCGLQDLQEYTMEVRDGIKDHWVRDPDDPNDTRWEYTYHERLFTYSVPGIDELYNQIEVMACKLAQAPYTRRAQAITWKPWEDPFCHDPACLQSIWCRILPDTDGVWYLNTNVRMRSNDAYKAAFMNMFAFVKLQEKIADRVSEHAGREVRVGRYVHQADSYHIYGSYMEEVNNVFLKAITNRRFTDRTYRYDKMKPYMEEAIPSILEKAKKYKGE